MAAIGTCWDEGTWTDDKWAADTWADAVGVATTFDNFSGAFMGYVQDLRDAASVPPALDSSSLVANDADNVVAGFGPWADLNTLYARRVC